MYVADAMGYLGYAVVLTFRSTIQTPGSVLPFFRVILLITAVVSIAALLIAWNYFRRALVTDVVDEPTADFCPLEAREAD